MTPPEPQFQFAVTVRETVERVIYTRECTEAEARNEPHNHEIEQGDVTVVSREILRVERN